MRRNEFVAPLKVVRDDGAELVSLSEVPALLEAFFDLPEDSIRKETVYVWWDRSVNNRGIRIPMPTPKARLANTHLWEQQQIIHWYAAWKGLDVRECPEAGDRIDRNGRMRRSPLRSVYGV